jgi:hypothetical protein
MTGRGGEIEVGQYVASNIAPRQQGANAGRGATVAQDADEACNNSMAICNNFIGSCRSLFHGQRISHKVVANPQRDSVLRHFFAHGLFCGIPHEVKSRGTKQNLKSVPSMHLVRPRCLSRSKMKSWQQSNCGFAAAHASALQRLSKRQALRSRSERCRRIGGSFAVEKCSSPFSARSGMHRLSYALID